MVNGLQCILPDNRKWFSAVLIFVVAVLLVSCKKDPVDIDRHLVTEYQVMYAYNAERYTIGEVRSYQFEWSDDKMCNEVLKYHNWNAYSRELTDAEFEYDGNKLVEIRKKDGVIIRFEYDNDLLTKMRTIMWTGDNDTTQSIVKYVYFSDGHLSEVIMDNKKKYEFTWEKDNVTEIRDCSSLKVAVIKYYEYDTKKSAYSFMPEWYILWREKYEWLSTNNVVSYSCPELGITMPIRYNYIYKGDYPVIRTETRSDAYMVSGHTHYYVYADGVGQSDVPKFYSVMVPLNDSIGYDLVYGGGVYSARSVVKLKADSYGIYSFLHWADGNTANTCSFQVTRDTVISPIYSYNK